jgi:peptidoglycan/LPS O-acetylase OafA/YrhL
MDGTSRYLPTLDGWRAVAITAVILSHGRESLFGPGSIWESPTLLAVSARGRLGVDLFFAISGYLITSRLLDEAHRSGGFDLGRFYVRRGLRILPPYLLYLVVIGSAGALGLLHVSGREIRDCLLFVRNYTMNQEGAYTNHFWSLAVEEHFYLLWPLLLLLIGKRWAVWLIPVFGLAVHVWRAADVRFHLFAMVFSDAGVGFRTDTRIDALLWGCEAALLMPVLARLRAQLWLSWSWAIVLATLASGIVFSLPMQPLWLATLFPILIVSTVLFPSTLAGRLLEWDPLRWVGRMSYSLYLWQTLFLQLPAEETVFFGAQWVTNWPWNLIAIVSMAVFSFYIVERPTIRFGHRITGHAQRIVIYKVKEVTTYSSETFVESRSETLDAQRNVPRLNK